MRKGKTIYHCHGKKKGKKYRTYKTVGQAESVHRAIMTNENQRKARRMLLS